MLTADLVKLDDQGAPWSAREIARRCKVGYTLVSKLRDEMAFVTARAGSERTYTCTTKATAGRRDRQRSRYPLILIRLGTRAACLSPLHRC
jgi:hypothetical protein